MKINTPKNLSLLILLILTSSISCQNNTTGTKRERQSDTTKSANKVKTEETAPGLNCDTTIVNQELSYGALAFKVFKLDTNKLKSLFLDPVVLKMEKQSAPDNGAYFLHHFTDGINKMILYRNDGGFYMEEADIKNGRVRLNKKISFGMQKATFLQLLKVTNIKCDTITVTDDEGSFASVYIFKNAKLSEIKMGQMVE
ncbi:MAG: hypothetical protein V4592_18205 [Bacteroidota bacterium]